MFITARKMALKVAQKNERKSHSFRKQFPLFNLIVVSCWIGLGLLNPTDSTAADKREYHHRSGNRSGNISVIETTKSTNTHASIKANSPSESTDLEGSLADLSVSIYGAPIVSFNEFISAYPSFDRERRESEAMLRCQNTIQATLDKFKEERLMVLKTEICSVRKSTSGSDGSAEGKVYFLPIIK